MLADAFSASASASASSEINSVLKSANKYTHNRMTSHTQTFWVNNSKPSYWYQMYTVVPLESGGEAKLMGGVFASKCPIA